MPDLLFQTTLSGKPRCRIPHTDCRFQPRRVGDFADTRVVVRRVETFVGHDDAVALPQENIARFNAFDDGVGGSQGLGQCGDFFVAVEVGHIQRQRQKCGKFGGEGL